MKYEYKVVNKQKELKVSNPDVGVKEFEKYIHKLAKRGWKLVAVDRWQMYFERELK